MRLSVGKKDFDIQVYIEKISFKLVFGHKTKCVVCYATPFVKILFLKFTR
jgi:hypothetical protein